MFDNSNQSAIPDIEASAQRYRMSKA